MQAHRAVNYAIFICVALLAYLVVPAQAEILYDAAIRGTYEDNVVGLLSDKRGGYAGMSMYGPMTGSPGMMMMGPMGPMGGPYQSYYPGTGTGTQTNKSDYSVNLFADLGGATKITPDASLFLIGSAQHTSYNTFTEFDYTIGNLSTGIYKEFGDVLSAKVAINGSIKRYDVSQRDSWAYGATLLLKEWLTRALWLKESYNYEKNEAHSSFFTYQSNSVGIWAGFLATRQTTLLLGYTYFVYDYEQPSGFRVTSNTFSLGIEHGFTKNWYVDGHYDRQISDSNVPGTHTTDNIFSVGLRYSY